MCGKGEKEDGGLAIYLFWKARSPAAPPCFSEDATDALTKGTRLAAAPTSAPARSFDGLACLSSGFRWLLLCRVACSVADRLCPKTLRHSAAWGRANIHPHLHLHLSAAESG